MDVSGMDMQVYHLSDLPHKQLCSLKTGEIFSKSAILTKLLSFEKIFVHHEILLPGKRASSPHCHSTQEEMIFVLDGFPTAHFGKQSRQLKPRDFIGFKPCAKEHHYIENTTDQEARFLVICSNPENDQVIF